MWSGWVHWTEAVGATYVGWLPNGPLALDSRQRGRYGARDRPRGERRNPSGEADLRFTGSRGVGAGSSVAAVSTDSPSQGVVACRPGELVVAALSEHGVVAAASLDDVGGVGAGQLVGSGRSDDAFEEGERICALSGGGPSYEVHGDGRGSAVVQDIDAGAPVEPVAA